MAFPSAARIPANFAALFHYVGQTHQAGLGSAAVAIGRMVRGAALKLRELEALRSVVAVVCVVKGSRTRKYATEHRQVARVQPIKIQSEFAQLRRCDCRNYACQR